MAWWIAILITGSLKSASKLNIHQLCNSNSLPHTTFRVWPNMILIGWLVLVVRVFFISIYFIFEATSTKLHGSLLMRVLTSDCEFLIMRKSVLKISFPPRPPWGPLDDGLMGRHFCFFKKDVKKMEEKDDELQTNFGATRCSIWGLALVSTGDGGQQGRRAHWGIPSKTGETGGYHGPNATNNFC